MYVLISYCLVITAVDKLDSIERQAWEYTGMCGRCHEYIYTMIHVWNCFVSNVEWFK